MKYRKQVLPGVLAEQTRDLIREICKVNDVEIIKGHVSKDNIHLNVTDEVIMQYIENQDFEDKDDNFNISTLL